MKTDRYDECKWIVCHYANSNKCMEWCPKLTKRQL